MSTTPFALATKDLANGQLNSGISSNTLSIPVQSGQGANFPQPYAGTCTSGGTATTLNCTGISATIGGAAQVGKFIYNFTDNSFAAITAVNTNSLTTTTLLGGADNSWENADAWRIDPFVLSLEKHDGATPYNVTAREEALVTGRSTDTLTVATASERGYNGTTAQSFSASDYAYLHVASPVFERFKDLMSVVTQQVDVLNTRATLYYTKPVLIGYSDSSTGGASSTSRFQLDTNTYTIPANSLVAGVTYEYHFAGTFTWVAGTLELDVFFGTTAVGIAGMGTPGGGGMWRIDGRVYGLGAANAGATVRNEAVYTTDSPAASSPSYQSTGSIDTTGTLLLQAGGKFGTSNAGNGMICKAATIIRHSTTAS